MKSSPEKREQKRKVNIVKVHTTKKKAENQKKKAKTGIVENE
jgi:hypothetical protein